MYLKISRLCTQLNAIIEKLFLTREVKAKGAWNGSAILSSSLCFPCVIYEYDDRDVSNVDHLVLISNGGHHQMLNSLREEGKSTMTQVLMDTIHITHVILSFK
jgi:hypothetical protein